MPTNIEQWLGLALWIAGAGHFCVLIASFQVPQRLKWKEDLAKLATSNRKLMWVYGGFTIYTVAACGAMTLALHGELMRGETSARVLACFIGLYWLLRIVVDFCVLLACGLAERKGLSARARPPYVAVCFPQQQLLGPHALAFREVITRVGSGI